MSWEPEQPLEPAEQTYLTAACNHEVYPGENMFEWEGKTLCPDCLEDKFSELRIEEKADLMGCAYIQVREKSLYMTDIESKRRLNLKSFERRQKL